MALHMRLHEFGREALLKMARGARHPHAVGRAARRGRRRRCSPSASCSSCTSATRPRSRSCTGPSTTPSTRTCRTSSAWSWPTPASPSRTGSAWRRRFGVLFSGLFLSGEAFVDVDGRGIGQPAPPDPPRRPRRMTGPVPPDLRAPSRLNASSLTSPIVATPDVEPAGSDHAASDRRPRAPLHARLRHRRHRPQGQRARRQGRLRGRPGPGPDDLPDVARAHGREAHRPGQEAARGRPRLGRLPRHGAPRPSSSARRTSSPRRARAPRSTPSCSKAWSDFDLTTALAKALGKPTRVANDADVQGARRHQGPRLRGGDHPRHRLRHGLLHRRAACCRTWSSPTSTSQEPDLQRAAGRARPQEDRRQEVEQAGARRRSPTSTR